MYCQNYQILVAQLNLLTTKEKKWFLMQVVLYMDLDIIIAKNFDEEIATVISGGKDVNCVSDAIGWMGEKFSSSLMILKSYSRD